MEQKKGKTPSPFSAGYDAGSCKKTGDSPQAEKEELNEDTNESLCENLGIQTSISEKQMTADEKFSEEGVRDTLPRKSVHSLLRNFYSAFPSSFRSLECSRWFTTMIRPLTSPPPQRQNIRIISALSVHNSVNKCEVGERRDQVLPTTTVHRDPDKGHSVMSDLLLKHSCKRADASVCCSPSCKTLRTTVPQSMAVTPSVTLYPQNSARVEQAFPNTPTQLVPLLDSAPFSGAFNWNVRRCKPSHKMSDGGYFLPGPCSKRHLFQRSSKHLQSIIPSDTGPLYPKKSPAVGQVFPHLTGESLKKDASGFPVQSESEPGGDNSAVEETGHHSTKNFLPVDSHLQPHLLSCLTLPVSPLTLAPMLRPWSSRPPSLQSSSFYKPRMRNLRGHSSGSKKKHKKDSFSIASTIDSPDATPGVNQDNTREMEPPATAGPSTLQLSTNNDSEYAAFYDRQEERDESSVVSDWETASCEYEDTHFLYTPSLESDQILDLPNREDTDDGGPRFNNSSSSFLMPTCSQSKAPTVAGPPCPQSSPTVLQDSTVCTEGSGLQDSFELLSVQSESNSGGDSDVLVEMETSVAAVNYSVTNTLPSHSHLQTSSSDPGWTKRGSSCLSRSHSVPSLSQITSAENKTFTPSNSSPDMLLKNSFEEFTPDITADEDDETYRFQCSCPGLYQCSVTGLVFHMEGGGDVVYRIVPWNRRLLARHHKQPAGPLFDIKCLQQSVCQLHLPHCEIRSTGGCEFLSVAHVNDEDIEFIGPQKTTETHVIINITGFSAFGNVKDEDSPPDPVRALVLLFYRPPADPDLQSLLNVLLLPRNVVLRDVLRTRKNLDGDERYIETPPHCKLHPKQEYTLSTSPEDSVLVQPTEAEFDEESFDNYFPSFQVNVETVMKHIKLVLRDTNSSHSVWERRVCLSSTGVKRSCGPSAPNERLLDIRSSFIDGISGPVLKSLLDKLLEKAVMTDSERESADEMQNIRDKARFVIDTVRKKGEAASSEMIEILCEADPVLCEHLSFI